MYTPVQLTTVVHESLCSNRGFNIRIWRMASTAGRERSASPRDHQAIRHTYCHLQHTKQGACLICQHRCLLNNDSSPGTDARQHTPNVTSHSRHTEVAAMVQY
jgi:hypothetical protein